MKRSVGRLAVALIFFAPHPFLGGTDTPPYTTPESEVGIKENFNEAFRILDTHKHAGGDDSSRLFDVVPASPSVYDLGSSSAPWQNVHLSTSVVFNVLFDKTTLLVDGNPKLMPSFIGQLVLSSGTYDLWVATGLGTASWKVFRSTENRKY